MNITARLVQLFSRWISFGLFWIAGSITGETISAEGTATINDFSTAIAVALAGLVTFFVDLFLHRLQKSRAAETSARSPS